MPHRTRHKKKNYSAESSWAFVAAITILVVGIGQGWFGRETITTNTINNKEVVTNTQIIERLQTPPAPEGETCTLAFTPTTIASGDTVTGTFSDGLVQDCTLYLNFDDTGWVVWDTLNTGPTGTVTVTDVVDSAPGVFNARVLCPDCASNYATLTITPAPPPPEADYVGPPLICSAFCTARGFTWGSGPHAHPYAHCTGMDVETVVYEPYYCCCTPAADILPTCDAVCTAKGFIEGAGPYASSSSCTGTQVAEYQSGSSGPVCCCTPAGGGGHSGDGTTPYTVSECNAAKESEGKTSYSTAQTNIDDCGGFAWSNCNTMGQTLKYFDWLAPNCCLWTCEVPG